MTGSVLVKDRLWKHINYEPHSGQQVIHESMARHRVASCGRRFGKSKLGGHELVPYALLAHAEAQYLGETGQQRYYWIVGPNYDDDEREWRVFYDACKRLKLPFDKPGTYNDTVGGNMRMSLWSGRFIVECRSSAHPDSLDGEGLDGVLMVEAAKMKPSVWSKFIRPALADKRGWSLHTSTPEGKNHFYEKWQIGQDPAQPAWSSWRMPSWINTTVFPGGRQDPEIVDMAQGSDMTEERFNQEIAALFTEFVGRVFPVFDEEIHVQDVPYDPTLPLYGCCDYGFTNPFVWLAIQTDVWDNVYVIAEYRRTQMDITDIASELVSWRGGLAFSALEFYPDPESPGDTSVLSNKLAIPARKHTGGLLSLRLESIRQALKLRPDHAPEHLQKPRLVIDRSCLGLISELQDYRYPDTKKERTTNAPENPMKKDDHGPEALGRFFKGHFGTPDDLHARTTQTSARVRRS